jgi:hypothetical protein
MGTDHVYPENGKKWGGALFLLYMRLDLKGLHTENSEFMIRRFDKCFLISRTYALKDIQT